MRLPVDAEIPSTSSDSRYMPSVPQNGRKDALFGYDHRRKGSVPAPWASKRYSLSIRGLHEEILDLYRWLRPSKLDANLRMSVFEKVSEAIKERWKDHGGLTVSVFGSLRTFLFLPTSDIDVLVECPAWDSSEETRTRVLNETADALRQTGMAESITVFGEAFVPIVKMVDKDTKVSIDISFNTVQGVKAAHYIEQVKKEFPVVEPLVLILKQFLIQRNLNQTYTGGLSSYGLILMLISFLQMYAMPARGKHYTDPDVNLGEFLMRFFEVYSQEFNYMEVGISVRDCCYKRKEHNGEREKAPVLSIEDPLLPTNEVGRSTFNFGGVQAAFSQALQVLNGIFVRERRRSAFFASQVYSGSMLSLIMCFTPQQIAYRDWLKSFSMSYKNDPPRTRQLITNTCLSPVVNLDTAEWHALALTTQKVSKRLVITPPDEAPSQKSGTMRIDDRRSRKVYGQDYAVQNGVGSHKSTDESANEDIGDETLKADAHHNVAHNWIANGAVTNSTRDSSNRSIEMNGNSRESSTVSVAESETNGQPMTNGNSHADVEKTVSSDKRTPSPNVKQCEDVSPETAVNGICRLNTNNSSSDHSRSNSETRSVGSQDEARKGHVHNHTYNSQHRYNGNHRGGYGTGAYESKRGKPYNHYQTNGHIHKPINGHVRSHHYPENHTEYFNGNSLFRGGRPRHNGTLPPTARGPPVPPPMKSDYAQGGAGSLMSDGESSQDSARSHHSGFIPVNSRHNRKQKYTHRAS